VEWTYYTMAGLVGHICNQLGFPIVSDFDTTFSEGLGNVVNMRVVTNVVYPPARIVNETMLVQRNGQVVKFEREEGVITVSDRVKEVPDFVMLIEGVGCRKGMRVTD
jgi:hypothetical protein